MMSPPFLVNPCIITFEDLFTNTLISIFFKFRCKIRTLCLVTKDFKYFCNMKRVNYEDTICALASGGGMSAIALIRISGDKSISTINNIFSKNLTDKKSHTAHFGNIIDKTDIIDDEAPVECGIILLKIERFMRAAFLKTSTVY